MTRRDDGDQARLKSGLDRGDGVGARVMATARRCGRERCWSRCRGRVLLLGGGGPGLRGQAAHARTPASSSRATSSRWPARRSARSPSIKLTEDGQAGSSDHRQRRLRAAAPGHPRGHPPGVAVGHRQPLRRPPAGPDGRQGDPDNGAILPAETTESAVDLDQLFNTFDPETRKAAQAVIEGFARRDAGPHRRRPTRRRKYLNPVLSALVAAVRRARPQRRRARALHRQDRPAGHRRRRQARGPRRHRLQLRPGLDRAGQPDTELADAIRRLPGFLRKSNTTFVNLRATLDDLDPLVDASKPVVRDLRPLLADLRPVRPRRPADLPRPRPHHPPPRRRQRPRRAAARPARGRPATTQQVQANGALRPSTFDLADGRAHRRARRRWRSSARTRRT